jgi:hypothetical protein
MTQVIRAPAQQTLNLRTIPPKTLKRKIIKSTFILPKINKL